MIAATRVQSRKQFPTLLAERIETYFEERGLSKAGDARMAAKVATGLIWWLASYSLIYVWRLPPWWFVAAYLMHGLSHVFLTFNVAHDANHGALSRRRWVNALFSYCFELCGTSSYMWRIFHHQGHHHCINVYGEDDAILPRGAFRFSPHAPPLHASRFQHIYALLLYCGMSLNYIFVKDIDYFFFSDYRYVKGVKHPRSAYLALLICKPVYLLYMLALPVVAGKYPVWLVLGAFLFTHLLMGLYMTLVFQASHVVDDTEFPLVRGEYERYTYHVFATTSDYSTHNWFSNLFLGGLNHHVVHHLYAHICHIHYPQLTPIVKQTARECGVEYRENPTLASGVIKHLRLLRRLGNEGGPTVAATQAQN